MLYINTNKSKKNYMKFTPISHIESISKKRIIQYLFLLNIINTNNLMAKYLSQVKKAENAKKIHLPSTIELSIDNYSPDYKLHIYVSMYENRHASKKILYEYNNSVFNTNPKEISH